MNSQNSKLNFDFKIPSELVCLAELFKKAGEKLYIVGGFVRDSLLNKNPFDIDICSPLKLEQVKTLLRSTNFSYKTKNKQMGTATICVNNLKFEYTVFRTDIYALDGTHSPVSVDFVKNIKLDALRRDFYVNALYFDVQNNMVVDPLNKGLCDLEQQILTVIPHAENTFKEDAVRILRLVKFSALLNFEIEKNTLKQATQHSNLLNNITPARLKKELAFIQNLPSQQKEKINQILFNITNKKINE